MKLEKKPYTNKITTSSNHINPFDTSNAIYFLYRPASSLSLPSRSIYMPLMTVGDEPV